VHFARCTLRPTGAGAAFAHACHLGESAHAFGLHASRSTLRFHAVDKARCHHSDQAITCTFLPSLVMKAKPYSMSTSLIYGSTIDVEGVI
jgi:hypothetical protein